MNSFSDSLRRVILTLALVTGVTTSSISAPKLRVIATIPELAEFTREIGGNHVEVESLATGVEDPHGIPMKPSFVPKLSRADIVVLLGLENEHAYLPALLEACKNPKVQNGAAGYIDTSKDITPLEVPTSLSRAEGEVHPAGNPHYNLDPVLVRTILKTILEGLVRNAPSFESDFRKGRDEYQAKLDAKIVQWQTQAKPLQGVKFVSYHNHWPYFSERFGLHYLGTIELKHGIEPTAKHVSELVTRMKAENCKLVVREPQFSDKVPRQIAAACDAKLVTLPIMVGGVPQAKTYLEMIDYDLSTLLQAIPTVSPK